MKDVLNQTKTSFVCVGTAYEVSLEEKVNSKGDECIMGSIILRVPGGTQRFRVYSNKFNKTGKNAGKVSIQCSCICIQLEHRNQRQWR